MKQGAQRFDILSYLSGTSFHIRILSLANLFFVVSPTNSFLIGPLERIKYFLFTINTAPSPYNSMNLELKGEKVIVIEHLSYLTLLYKQL